MTAREAEKSAEAFRTISEAAAELDLPQHVLRHWEDVFGHIRPMRRAGGRRYYRPYDIELLRGVRTLLYEQRYTTKGVQKIFKANGPSFVSDLGRRAGAGEQIELTPDSPAKTPGAGAQAGANAGGMGAASQKLLEEALTRLDNAQDALDDALVALDALDIDEEE